MKMGKVIIMGSRGNGKSTELLRIALEDHADIAVVGSPKYYIDIATENLHIPQEETSYDRERNVVKIRDVEIAPIHHFICKKPTDAHSKPLYVDELECAVSYLLQRGIQGYTLSTSEYYAEV